MKASPRPPPPPSLSRESLADLFLRVSTQLDALQPRSTHPLASVDSRRPNATSQAQNDPTAESLLLPSRERVHEVLRSNERFRPAEDIHKRRVAFNKPPANNRMTAPTASPRASLSRRESIEATPAPDTSLAPIAQVFMPVGGRARVFQSSDLARAKRSMKKRCQALTHLQTSVAVQAPVPDTTSWDIAQSTLASAALSGKQALIAELVHGTEFTTQHIFHLSRKFKEIAGANKSVISFAEFRQILTDDVAALMESIGVSTGDDTVDGGASEAGESLQSSDMRLISATISTSESFLRRLFQTFDGDSDGRIDFKEFVVGLNGFIKGSIDDKVDALFGIYQTTNTDTPQDENTTEDAVETTVAISDLLGLFQGDRQLYQELMRCVDEYFLHVELPTSASEEEDVHTIGREDFVAASLANPNLLETITRPTMSLMFSEDSALRERLKTFVSRRGIHWRKMVELQQRVFASTYAALSGGTSSSTSTAAVTSVATGINYPPTDLRMSVASLLRILTESLDTVAASAAPSPFDDDDELNLILRCYIAKSSSSSSSDSTRPATAPLLDVPSFLQDLTVVLLHPTAIISSSDAALDTEAKARYYFELYDLNRDGLLSRSELVSAVCAGFAHFGPHLTEVVRVLEDEDADQDGHLTKAQYLRAARRSALILASLYTCL